MASKGVSTPRVIPLLFHLHPVSWSAGRQAPPRHCRRRHIVACSVSLLMRQQQSRRSALPQFLPFLWAEGTDPSEKAEVRHRRSFGNQSHGAHHYRGEQTVEETIDVTRSHFGPRAISCSNVHGVFTLTSASGFALSKCLHPNFVVSHLFPWNV